MPQNRPVALEVCVDTAQGLATAAGLADRIELCSALDLGGLTPSAGLMQMARATGAEVHAMIRPNPGDFQMTARDLATACHDIRKVRDIGLAGVVIGATADSRLDMQALSQLVAAADGLHITLHRAIDTVADPFEALEAAIALGIGRILTSGGAGRALDGAATIARLHEAARNRITIMAGAGITADNAAGLLAKTGVRDIHASCRGPRREGPNSQFGFGAPPATTDAERIKALRVAIR